MILWVFMKKIIVNSGEKHIGVTGEKIVVLPGGDCHVYGASSPIITVRPGGLCYTYDSSIPKVKVHFGGGCFSFDSSSPKITRINRGGKKK